MPSPFLPFYALGFSRNPFGALTRDEWAEVAVLPPALAKPITYLQLIGPKGCGKTTHLLALADRCAAGGETVAYEHLSPGQHRFTTPLDGLDRFLLDEAQRLGPFARGSLLRAAARGLRLVIATHRDLSPHAARHDLRFTTLCLPAQSSPDHLRAVIDRRLARFALTTPPPVTLASDAVDWLWTAYGANLRAALDHLYEVFQRCHVPAVLCARDLAAISLIRPDRR